MKRKILFLIFVLAGLALFLYYGQKSENEIIRGKAQEILEDKSIKMILEDIDTVSNESKEYLVFRTLMKENNSSLSEKEIFKKYIIYNALAEKAKDAGIELSREDIQSFENKANDFVLITEDLKLNVNEEMLDAVKNVSLNEANDLLKKINEKNALMLKLEENFEKSNPEEYRRIIENITSMAYNKWDELIKTEE